MPGLIVNLIAGRLRGLIYPALEYDANLIDGYDYDLGAALLRSATAADESELLSVLREWQLVPSQFRYAWDTADPR